MINNDLLHENQKEALDITTLNDFQSGVYFHATGTGKSWISLEIILKYNQTYPEKHILWLCEKKSILLEQFKKETIKNKGYSDIFNKFFIINYTELKPKDWYKRINNALIWKKPILLIINRAFLVSQEKYTNLNLKIDLIIHDECHSIVNATTQKFYNYILEKNPHICCLGFSATPVLTIKPYTKIISKFTIYDAFCKGVILPPKIHFVKSDKSLNDNDIIDLCKIHIKDLYYKKIIVWCGIIDKCYQLAKLWKNNFPNFNIAIDTSKDDNEQFDSYSETDQNAILFCACKHREGSDIKNLDACIFLDKVENRSSQTFIQCIGRVLRKDKDGNKKYGLILDLKASSCIKLCDRMNEYLTANVNFPWKYQYKNIKIGSTNIISHCLQLKKVENIIKTEPIYGIADLIKNFVRKCPDKQEYIDRLKQEFDIISKKKLENYIIRAVHILKLTDFIPHVTRGSCGSSLVCYLLGISNVDPIQLDISFSRFLNEYRDTLPDIDFDFPHYLRDEVFLKLELHWPNQVARISNHVHWHEKSALREAIRMLGIKKMIPKEQLDNFIKSLPKKDRQQINNYKENLENKFRHYSLHCGGIVFFHQGIPENLVINRKTLSQIVYDKRDVSKTKNFKIDILSSRGISQLIGISGYNIDFTDCPYDEDTYQLLQSGNNIGITLAESPLMRKALMNVKPKSIKDLAICLAIIRPAAKDTRTELNTIDYNNKFIFDDDAIHILSNLLNIDESLADKYRRCLSKNKWTQSDLDTYKKLYSKLNNKDQKNIDNLTQNIRMYSFCKAHSYSYAQLVYKLAYQKVHNPTKFWYSTIKNVKSSYRKWVHLHQASINGVDLNFSELESAENDDETDVESNPITIGKEVSIYAESRHQKFKNLPIEQQMYQYGYWDMKKYNFYPNCYFYQKDASYYFSGIIASMRIINKKPRTIVCFLGVDSNKYIEIIIKNKYIKDKKIGVKGRALLKNQLENTYDAYIAHFY